MWVRALGRWGLHSNSYCSGGAHRGERNTKYHVHVHQQHNTNTNTGERNNKIILNQQIIKIILNQQIIKITGSLSSIDQSIFMALPRVGGVTPVTGKKHF